MTNKQKYWKDNNIIQIRGDKNTRNLYFVIKDENAENYCGNWLNISSFDDDLLCVDKNMPEFDVVNVYENIFSR